MDMQTILFDEFLTALLRLVRTFNLGLQKIQDDSDEPVINEVIATPSMLRAVNESHFNMFHNIVEFWCLLLPRLSNDRLKNWMYLSASALIDLSLKRPLVSGFYKMLSAMLSVAAKRKLFDGYRELYAEQRKFLNGICEVPGTQVTV